jgi:hypothetical protein
MAITSSASLVDTLRQCRLLDAAQLDGVKSIQAQFADAKVLAGELLRRGWLTAYQANLLLQGRGQELLLGSYVLLERLGEGGDLSGRYNQGTVYQGKLVKELSISFTFCTCPHFGQIGIVRGQRLVRIDFQCHTFFSADP